VWFLGVYWHVEGGGCGSIMYGKSEDLECEFALGFDVLGVCCKGIMYVKMEYFWRFACLGIWGLSARILFLFFLHPYHCSNVWCFGYTVIYRGGILQYFFFFFLYCSI
jgi:hypothetical protein